MNCLIYGRRETDPWAAMKDKGRVAPVKLVLKRCQYGFYWHVVGCRRPEFYASKCQSAYIHSMMHADMALLYARFCTLRSLQWNLAPKDDPLPSKKDTKYKEESLN